MRTFTLSTVFFILIFALAGEAHTLPSAPETSDKPIIDTLTEKYKVYRIRDGYYYTLLYGDNKVDSCSEVEKVTGSDRYVYYTGYPHGDCMLDAKTGRSYPVKTNLYDVSYLFDYKGKPLFTTGHIIFDLTGLEVAVEGQALHVDPANSSKERGICITNSYFSQGFINPKKLKNGTTLSLDREYEVNLFEEIDVNTLADSPRYYYNSSQIHIRIPLLYENPVLRQNVLFWLSEIMMEELHAYDFDVPSFVYTNPFVPSTETTTMDFVNYYAALILQGCLDVTFYDDEEEYFSQFWGGGYSAIAERLMKSDNLVTFFAPVDSNFGGGSGFGACAIPIATFNISDGRRIMLKDIIKEEHQEEFANFLRDEFEKQEPTIFSYQRPDEREMLSFPVGMLADSLIFPISRHTILGAGGEISVPYSKIENWLKLRPTFNNIPPLDECNVIVKKSPYHDLDDNWEMTAEEVVEEAEAKPFNLKKYTEGVNRLIDIYKSHTPRKPVDRQAAASTLNGGINFITAEDAYSKGNYEEAYRIYGLLSDHYGYSNPMNGISYVDKSLIKASRNRTDELIRQNELTKASELCDEIIYRIGNDTAYSSLRYKLPYFDALILKSRIHARKDSLMQALYETKKAVGFLNDNFSDILLNVPRTEREEAWEFYNHWYMNFIPMMASLTTDEVMLRRAYEAMLNGKGLLLNTELAVRNAIYQSGDSIAISLLDKSNSLADQLSRLASERNNNVEERERKMDELREEYQKVGEEIAARSEFFARNSSMTNINFGDVAESLDNDEAAIEFISVKSDDFRLPPAYFALILRKGYAYPSMIRLGDSETIERLATENPYRNTDLFNSVWQPLLPYLAGISTVYFSPAGILQTTGIEHLPVDDDGTVIGDSLNLHRVSSTKEIVYHKRSNEGDIAPGAGIFYGGIDYDLSDNMAFVSAADDMAALSIADKASDRSSLEMPVFRSSFNGFIDRSSISPLLGTDEEIRNIIPFAKNIDILDSVIYLTGSHATEEKFKDMAQHHPKLLHIATHGFYFTEEELAEMAEEDFIRSISTAERDIDDIDLLRSGLIFAGVNNLVVGTDLPENADDGILTAKEISLLNLSDVDIAILSACQTALGDIGTDGVMGLQRGFKKAGTQSLLMSLWNVDDKATSLFMTEFYRQFSASGDKAMALREARKYLRGYEDGIYDHPHFWAAFILLDGL